MKSKQFIQYKDEYVYITLTVNGRGLSGGYSVITFLMDQRLRGQKYHAAHPECEKARNQVWREANPEKDKMKSKVWAAAHPERTQRWKEANPEKCRVIDAKVKAKRKRDLGYEPINSWFSGCNGHHIDANMVIHIPKELHQSISHRQSNFESMMKINNAAFEWLCTQEVVYNG